MVFWRVESGKNHENIRRSEGSHLEGSGWRVLRPFDPWKSPLCTCPIKYTVNPYTGCSLGCHYCYATSYIGKRPSSPKDNLVKRLILDLKKAKQIYPVDIALSSDPYPPVERRLNLTRAVLKTLISRGFRVQVTTKSDLVLKDIDLLMKGRTAVSFTITTLDGSLAKKLEPGAPNPARRIRAAEKLVKNGIPVSVRIDPIIPHLNDDGDEIAELIEALANIGVSHIVTSTYKARPDNFKRMINAFPELEKRWRRLYYPNGKMELRYSYLEIELRKKLLKPVVDTAKKLNLTYATCRENLTTRDFYNAPTCDGTHLLYSWRNS